MNISFAARLMVLLMVTAAASASTPEELVERGQWKRARALLEEQVKTQPSAHSLFLLSRVRLAFGDYERALELAQRASSTEPRNADYRFAVAGAYGNLARNAGKLRQFGLARTFKREVEAVLELDPRHIEARHALIAFHLQAPGLVGGSKAKARDLVQEILSISPVEGYLAEARLAAAENRPQEVEPLLLKAVAAGPNSYTAHIQLAAHYGAHEPKKYELAEKHAREALRLDPQRSPAYSLLAQGFALQEQWSDLDAILAQSERLLPENLNPHYQAGRVLLAAGKDLPRAEAYFRKYLTQEPEPGSPPRAAAHWRLGLVLEKLGRKQEAIAQLQEGLRADPKFEPARKDLKRLR